MIRRVLWGVLVIGVALIAAPFVMQLPSRGDAGQTMIDGFKPIMQADSVKVTADYYNNVFVPLRGVVPAVSAANVAKFENYLQGMQAMEPEVVKLIPALADQLHMTPAQVQQFLLTQFPATAQLLQGLPQLEQDFAALLGVMSKNVDTFSKVPPGLDHYQPLVSTMQANVDNYQSISSLPNFRLFTWFFVVPGVLLVALAGLGLVAARRETEAGVAPAAG